MEGRIKEANGRGPPIEHLENADEVFTLVRKYLRQGDLPFFLRIGKDHFAHGVDAVALKEHMLGAAEANAAGSEGDSMGRLFRRVGVGAHAHPRGFRAPVHELFEILIRLALAWIKRFFDKYLDNLRSCRRNLAGIDLADGTVD